MLSMYPNSEALNFHLGQSWSSFEQFRTDGAKALAKIQNGAIATLQTKTGQYRILAEQDFQHLLGLASDVDRLRGGLRVLTLAIKAAQTHPAPETLEVLEASVALLGSLPELPVRTKFEALLPENEALEADDEVILDPQALRALYLSSSTAQETPSA